MSLESFESSSSESVSYSEEPEEEEEYAIERTILCGDVVYSVCLFGWVIWVIWFRISSPYVSLSRGKEKDDVSPGMFAYC